MEKIIAVVLTVLAVTQAGVVPRVQLSDWSILKCENGSLHGVENLIQIIHETASLCGESQNKGLFFPCLADGLGIMEADGTPDLNQFKDLLSLVFSETILEDLPEMKASLMKCGHAFAASYNYLTVQDGGVEEFFMCTVQVVQKYMDEIPKVCAYEYQFNGQ